MAMPLNHDREASGKTPPARLLAAVERRMLDLAAADGWLGRAARHHLGTGGKRLRARLALDAAAGLGVGPGPATAWAAACELLHNASLVHDDLQDGDRERRGVATVWARFGPDTAISLGDHLMTAAYRAVATVGVPQTQGRLLALTAEAVAETIRGQSRELDQRRHGAPGGWADYAAMARAKSGPLLALPLSGALILAGRPERERAASEAAGRELGLAYQIADDLADFEVTGPWACPDALAAGNAVAVHMAGAGAAWEGGGEGTTLATARAACRARLEHHLGAAQDLAGPLPEPLSRQIRGLAMRIGAMAGVLTRRPAGAAPRYEAAGTGWPRAAGHAFSAR